MTPSADVLVMGALLVLQQVLHYREKRDLLDRLGKPAAPAARTIPQKTMAEAMKDIL